MAQTKEVAVIKPEESGYLSVLNSADTNALEVLRENIGTGGLSRFDLTRIKIPAGGGTHWEVPTLTGPEMMKSLEGIIIWWTPMRAYWQTGFGEGGGAGSPPDCASNDGVVGIGEPGGPCADCPCNEWGTAMRDGKPQRGKACKEIRALFMLSEGQLLPQFVAAAPMSLDPMKKYNLALAQSGLFYHSVVTALELEQSKNADGIVYSRIRPHMVRKLIPEEVATLAQYKNDFQAYLKGAPVAEFVDAE